MKNNSNNIISVNSTLKESLILINNLTCNVLCLFVVDIENKLVGTLTDGDIRRTLIAGNDLYSSVEMAMNKKFVYVKINDISAIQIKQYRNKGITLLPLVNDQGEIIRIYDLTKRKSLLPIDAVLMAGGKGIRLRPLTENTPKPLLKVGKKAIIDHNIDSLMSYGVENFHINTNYLAEQIELHFENDERGLNISCLREPEYLGTMGSVKYIENFKHEMVLVMNSDLFTNINFEDLYFYHLNQNSDITVAAIPYSVNVPYGIFEIENTEIIGLREKPTYNYYANGGIYLIKRKLFELIPKDTYFDATEFIELAIKKLYKVTYFPIIGYWIDIGKHEDYKKVQEFVNHLHTED
jgi:dTDP-glucose pyrophosphorylase